MKANSKLRHTFQRNKIKKTTVVTKKKKIITGCMSLVYNCIKQLCRVRKTVSSIIFLPSKPENPNWDHHNRHNKLGMALHAWNPSKDELWGWAEAWKFSDLLAWPLWQSYRWMRDADLNKRYSTLDEWHLRLPFYLYTHLPHMCTLSNTQMDTCIYTYTYIQTGKFKKKSQGKDAVRLTIWNPTIRVLPW